MTLGLSRDSLLERAPAITLKLSSAGNAVAIVEGRTIPVGIHALEVLAACTEPRKLEDLARSANVSGARDFVDFVGTVVDMVGTGLLRIPGAGVPVADRRGLWNDPGIHAQMLNDTARTAGFIEAIRQTVRPDDIVLDIGTGTGVLAIAAAKAGAKKVYAIEASDMSDAARAMVDRNDVSDRVEVLRGWSTRLKLADRATVLVTETIGNEPFSEHALEILIDARKRLLTEDCRVIPRGVSLYAVLVEAPGPLLDRLSFSAENIERWTKACGIDFSPLRLGPAGNPASISAERARDLRELSEPVLIDRLDYAAPAPVPDSSITLEVSRAGKLAGVLLYFVVDVADGISITTRPCEAAPSSHWLPTLWLEPEVHKVAPGHRVVADVHQENGSTIIEVRP